MIILGIDPGANGGVAAVDLHGHIEAHKMPDTEEGVLDLIGSFKANKCYIEKVHSTPIQGHSGAFTFGMGYGGLRMAALAHGMKPEGVSPAKWQADMRCSSGGDKNVTKRRAQELFPHIKVTHAIADALLIAEWARIINSTKIFPYECNASLPDPELPSRALKEAPVQQPSEAMKTLLDL